MATTSFLIGRYVMVSLHWDPANLLCNVSIKVFDTVKKAVWSCNPPCLLYYSELDLMFQVSYTAQGVVNVCMLRMSQPGFYVITLFELEILSTKIKSA